MPDDQLITDGFGNHWQRCGPNCELEIVRPGKVQCNYCESVSHMDYLELEAREDGMWLHWCPKERALLSVEVGEPCNWCGEWEYQSHT